MYGFAMHYHVAGAHLIVLDASKENTVPYDEIDTPLTPGAKSFASSHAFFFADVNGKYYPNFPGSLNPNSAAEPNGKNVAVSAVLQIFGDVFDYATVSPLETSAGAIEGAGIYKW